MSHKVILLQGQQVGDCVYIKDAPDVDGQRNCVFKCVCGNLYSANYQNVKKRKSRSCGCRKKLGSNAKHRLTGKSEYTIYTGMITRSYKEKDPNFLNYGARGIKVCKRWRKSIVNFIADMGMRPSKNHSLERVKNNGNYTPKNCRWATRKEQNRNTRRNNYITYKGETKCLSEWCEILSLDPKPISLRIVRRKWDIERAFETPIGQPFKRKNLVA